MTYRFTVEGMTCGHCEKAVTRAIQEVDPDALIQIERDNNLVIVDSLQAPEPIAKAIAEEGYKVAVNQVLLPNN